MPVTGGELVARNIKKFGGGFIKHVNKTMQHVSKMLDEEITQNMNLHDHSLAALRRLGHPYRVGGQGLHATEGYTVHIQSGQLISAKKRGIVEGSIEFGELSAKAFVGIDSNKAPHVLHVIFGTSKMIPRPFMTESLKRVREPALALLKSNLKNFVFTFK